MSFKDIIAADIKTVFLNSNEMAEEHLIDDDTYTCVFDQDELTDNKIDGVYNMRRRLFVSYADLGYIPEPGQKMNIDGNYYYVVDCMADELMEVVLEARDT